MLPSPHVHRVIIWAAAVCLVGAAQAGVAAERVILQPGTKQLFLDGGVIDRLKRVRRTLNQPRKYTGNPIIKADPNHPWESRYIQTRDAPVWNPEARRWELLYWGNNLSTCLAVSADGLTWTKPVVGRHAVKGSKQNNLLWPFDPKAKQVFLYHRLYDARDSDPRRRWKALIGERSPRPAASPDGYAWTFLSEKQIPSGEEHHLTYDELGGQFVFALRTKDANGRRAVALSTSKDFVRWSAPKLIYQADPHDQELARQWLKRHLADPTRRKPLVNDPNQWNAQVYNMAVFPYEGIYIGLPTYFRMCGHSGKAPAGDGFSEMGLAVSRDLVNWRRVSGVEGFIPLSPISDGAYDTAQIEPSSRPIRRGDELWFYYSGLKYRYATDDRHLSFDTGAICLAMLRVDGFASLDAGDREGVILTKPLVWRGSALWVNADADEGELRTEVLDAECKPVKGMTREDCLAVSADGVRLPIRWKRRVGCDSLRGQTIRLRFYLRNARLYAFWSEARQAKSSRQANPAGPGKPDRP